MSLHPFKNKLRFVRRISESQGSPRLVEVLQERADTGIFDEWSDVPTEWENDTDRKKWIELCERANAPGYMFKQFYPLHKTQQ